MRRARSSSPTPSLRSRLALATALGMTAGLLVAVTSATTAQAAVPAELLVTKAEYPQSIKVVPSGAGTASTFKLNAADPALSPDGTRMVLRSVTDPERWVLTSANGTIQRDLFASPPQYAFFCEDPSWSPDGTKVVLTCSEPYDFEGAQYYAGLVVVDVATGVYTEPLAHGRFSDLHPTWSPRGDWIAFTRTAGYAGSRSRTMLVRPDGTGLTQLSAAPTLSEHSPAFSPDGSEVAFVTRAYERQNVAFVQEDLVVARLTDGTLRRVTLAPTSTTSGRYLTSPEYSPDGSTIAALELDSYQSYPYQRRVALVPAAGGAATYAMGGTALDADDLTWRAARTAVTPGSPTVAARPAPGLTTSRRVTAPASGVGDGPMVYNTQVGTYVISAPGATPAALTGVKFPRNVSATLDGTRFTYNRANPAVPGQYEVRSERVSTGAGVQLYSSTLDCAPKTWLDATHVGVDCRDGATATFTWGVLDVTADTLQVVRTGSLGYYTGWQESGPVWSPNGSTIAFTRAKVGNASPRVMLMNADGTNVRSSTTLATTADSGDRNPAWTPSGALVIATSRFATLDPLVHEDLALTLPGTSPILRLSPTPSNERVRFFDAVSVAPSGTRALVYETTSDLGDGGGKAQPSIYSLNPPTVAGAAGAPLFSPVLRPSTRLTAWARATA